MKGEQVFYSPHLTGHMKGEQVFYSPHLTGLWKVNKFFILNSFQDTSIHFCTWSFVIS